MTFSADPNYNALVGKVSAEGYIPVCGTNSIPITNPCQTNCQFSNVVVGPYANCASSQFDIPFQFNFTGAENSYTELYVSYGNNLVTLPYSSSGVYSGMIQNIPVTSSAFPIIISTNASPSCGYTYTAFSPPTSCDDPLPTTCSILDLDGGCEGSTYSLSMNVAVDAPNSESLYVKIDGVLMQTIAIVAGQHIYPVDLLGLNPDGLTHNITVEGVSCSNIPSENFIAPSSCVTGNDCGTNMSGTVTPCDPSNNRYSATVSGHIFCLPDVVTITEPESGISISVTPDSDGFFAATLENLSSDGASHTIYASSELNGGDGFSYDAPVLCSSTPSLKCGDPYNPPTSFSNEPLERLEVGDFFTAAGLNIIVETVNGSNGVFSGTGLLPTPFHHKKLKVNFTGVGINKDKVLTSGEVLGVSSGFLINEILPLDTFSIGGDICIVAPDPEGYDKDGFNNVTGLNDRGFGRDSLFHPGGTKTDPQGYDYNGIHADTGTPYDNFGCDMNDLNSDGQPCFRDSLAIKLRDSLYNNIFPGKVDDLISDNLNKFLDSLGTFDCDAIRTEMNAKLTTLGYDPKYIKGEENQYFNEGLSDHFSSEPKPMILNSGRNEDAKILEQKHIDLYKCDKLSRLLNELVKELQEIDKEKLSKYIKSQLGTLDKTQLQKLLDSNEELEKWILQVITDYIENNVAETIGFNEHKAIYDKNNSDLPKKKVRTQSGDFYNLATSNSENPFAFDYKPMPGEEETWLYNQGFDVIKGVNRGYYLEEAYRQQKQMELVGGEESFLQQPILLSKDSSGVKYQIYLDKIKLTPTNASLDAYFIFKVPSSNKKLAMFAKNLNWGSGGMIGETSLYLGSTIEMRLTNSALLRLNAGVPNSGGGTYVSWDCKGFQSISIDADVELCREFVTPLDPQTLQELPGDARFSVKVITTLRHWSDFYFSITANKAFAITKYPSYKWKLEGLTIDMSDYQSPSGNMFPEYESKNYNNGFSAAWRGFYLSQLSVTFPNDFTNGSAPVTAGVQNFVIDDTGVSGTAFATNLVTIENGNLAGWPFSLDTVKITVVQNHLNGGGLVGKIKVPVFNSPMRYAATMFPDNKYEFSVTTAGKQTMDMLLADVTLDPLCSVKVSYDNGNFLAVANLTGKMTIGAFGNNSFSLPELRFQNFRVSNKAPYFDAGKWTMKDSLGGRLAGFELTVSKLATIKKSETIAGVSLEVGVSLPLNMSAYGGLEILGTLGTDSKGRQIWNHLETKLNKFGLDSDFPGGHLRGYLENFAHHAQYGEGFQGMVKLKVNTLGEFEAMGLFGKTTFKYFFVDAAITLNTGVPLGPLELNGFIGGVSYKMNVIPNDGSPNISNATALPALGSSFTGNTYLPDDSKALGLRAGIKMRMVKNEKIFNGSVIFEMLFNSNTAGNGLASIAMHGKGQLMNVGTISGTLVESEGSKPSGVQGSLSAHIRFSYDFNTQIYTGKFAAYLTAGALSGGGPTDKMVGAEIYVSSSKWFFYFGKPGLTCGLELSGPLSVKLNTYMCIGTDIPALPEVPADVRAIAGDIKPNRAFANSGNGFLFGANFYVKAKINVLGLASAEMDANAGFDVMVRDFGDNATCAGRSGTLGINGWYATGQLWAKVTGKLKLLGFTIFDAGLASIMQAQFPNPFYAQGAFGIKIKTFFGKINKKVKMDFGEQCNVVSSNSDLGIKVIASVLPGSGASKLPTDIIPQVNFNVPITKMDIGDVFDLSIATIQMTSLKDGRVYPFTQIFDEEMTSLTIKPNNLFYSGDSIRFTIKVKIIKNGGQPKYEEESTTFTVGQSYFAIPQANVDYSYPVQGMANFYIDEYTRQKGFIQLKSGMPETFYNLKEGVTQKIRLTDKTGNSKIYDFVYDGINARIEFPLGRDLLSTSNKYNLEIVQFDANPGNITQPQNGVDVSKQSSQMTFGNMLSGSSTSSGGVSGGESVLYTMKFSTSIYNSFSTKMYALQKIGNTYVSQEPFDHVELKDMLEVSVDANDWTNYVKSKLYPSDGYISIKVLDSVVIDPIKVENNKDVEDDFRVVSPWSSTIKCTFRDKMKYDAANLKQIMESQIQMKFPGANPIGILSFFGYGMLYEPTFFDRPIEVKVSYTIPGVGYSNIRYFKF